MKPQIKNALEGIDVLEDRVFFYYPDGFESLPCVSYYELINADYHEADDEPYDATIEFMVDVWSKDIDEAEEVANLANEKMKSLGFRRTFSRDAYDPAQRIVNKNMRYSIVKEV
jgi:hypothetical protein